MHPSNARFIRPGDEVALIDGETGEVCTPWVKIPEVGPVKFPRIRRRTHLTHFVVLMRPVKVFPLDAPMWVNSNNTITLEV